MKKHINRFSIVFNCMDKKQQFARDFLNGLPPHSIAVYLGQAIYGYEHNLHSEQCLPLETMETRGIKASSSHKELYSNGKRGNAEQSANPEMLSSMLDFTGGV